MQKKLRVCLSALLLIIAAVVADSAFVISPQSAKVRSLSSAPAYLDVNQPIDKRAEDLISRMTLDEKIALLAGTGFDTVPIERLGIPALHMTDGPAGIRVGPATSFPASIALAASFDPALVHEVGKAIAQEAKAKGKNVLLAPCVNIQRVPQAGRNFESFGEDPFLAAKIGVGYVRGVQSEGVVAAVKHFAVNNQEHDRMTLDVRVSDRAMHEIYFPAFKAAVQEGDAWSVMAAYNKINTQHAAENSFLLTDVLKKRWGFKGMVMSDWGAVHSTVPTLKSGLDLEMPTGVFLNPDKVKQALASGEISEAIINDKARRIVQTMIMAGLLDGKAPDAGTINTPEHRKIALDAAKAGIVLLKNQTNLLPLDTTKIDSIAVIGPNADVARLGGGGSAKVVPFYSVSPLEGIKRRAGQKVRVEHAAGIVALEDTTPIPSENLLSPDGSSKGLLGEYYSNKDFSGTPMVTRVDPRLEFRWATGTPMENFPGDAFSIRWTGQLVAPVTGKYAISLSSNDGGRVYLDDKLIVDVWGDHATLTSATAVELKAGEPRRLRIEYYENIGNADIVLGWRRLEENTLKEAVAAAQRADAAIMFMGLSEAIEAEAIDRTTLRLPPEQEELINAVQKVNPNVIIVLNSGGPVLMSEWLKQIPTALQAFYLGQEGGNAIAEVLFGDVSPSGKLPATFPIRWADAAAYGYYPGNKGVIHYAENILVGYRWFDTKNFEPLFPFGHGLSYTKFDYTGIKVIAGKNSKEPIATVEFDLANTGEREGSEVVQVYVQDVKSSLLRPTKELKGFQKVFLKRGEKRKITIPLNHNAFAFYYPQKDGWLAEKGDFNILVGSSSRDIRLKSLFQLKESSFEK